jgi:hypothetical protein
MTSQSHQSYLRPLTTTDPDLIYVRDHEGEAAMREAQAALCRCGHARGAHYAMTGAMGSFGGSACSQCWWCSTFGAVE